MKPSEILDKAADLIEPKGAWTQGWFGRDSGGREIHRVAKAKCFCTIGAMLAAEGHDGFRRWPDRLASEYLHLAAGIHHIPNWNDYPARTQAEVVTALRQAAELARKDGR